MKLFIGEDRANSYTFVQDSITKNNKNIYLEIIVLPRPEGGMSATFMRGLVSDGKIDDFVQASIDNGLTYDTTNALYDEIESVMQTQSTSKRRKVKGGKRSSKRSSKRINRRSISRRSSNRRSHSNTKKRHY